MTVKVEYQLQYLWPQTQCLKVGIQRFGKSMGLIHVF